MNYIVYTVSRNKLAINKLQSQRTTMEPRKLQSKHMNFFG
jgi:hypothetical protein